jgi:hypothetical protein
MNKTTDAPDLVSSYLSPSCGRKKKPGRMPGLWDNRLLGVDRG